MKIKYLIAIALLSGICCALLTVVDPSRAESDAGATHAGSESRPSAERSAPDQSSVALKTVVNSINSTDALVKTALMPSQRAQATALAGKSAAVTGTVDEVYSPRDHHIVFLDFSKNFRSDIEVVAMTTAYAKLPDLKAFKGKRIVVSGTITMYQNRPQIVLDSSDQIKLVK